MSGQASTGPSHASPNLSRLSPRELEIVQRLLAGDRVPRIADSLYLAQSTVRNHLSSVFRKFGVNSQQQLIVLLRMQRAESRCVDAAAARHDPPGRSRMLNSPRDELRVDCDEPAYRRASVDRCRPPGTRTQPLPCHD
jgi:DNA-binding CsgD family transcriptional regulator